MKAISPSKINLGEHPFPNLKSLFGSGEFQEAKEVAAGIIIKYCWLWNEDTFNRFPNEAKFNSFFMNFDVHEIYVTVKTIGMQQLKKEGYITIEEDNCYTITQKFLDAINNLIE